VAGCDIPAFREVVPLAVVDLIEVEDEDGDYVAVWMDDADDTVVVQYNFVHLTLTPEGFTGLVDALGRARDRFERERG